MRRTAVGLALVGLLALAACGGGGSSGGKKLALGTEATVAYTTTASGTTPAGNTTLGVTVLAVRVGQPSDLTTAGIQVEDTAKDASPYYIDVKYENKGQGSVSRSLTVGLEDTDGNSVPTTLDFTFGTPFDLCKDTGTGTLDPGQSFESCTLILVPKGTKVDRVRFVSQGPDAKITFTDWAPS
jgi:hypothetical protein